MWYNCETYCKSRGAYIYGVIYVKLLIFRNMQSISSLHLGSKTVNGDLEGDINGGHQIIIHHFSMNSKRNVC